MELEDLKKVFKKKEKEKTVKERIDDELKVMLEALKGVDGESTHYDKLVSNAKKVAELKAIYEENDVNDRSDGKPRLNPNTVITAGSYIVGTLLVLMFEYDGGVIATRALQFLPKPRI